MRRKQNALVPFERAIIQTARIDFYNHSFYGYELRRYLDIKQNSTVYRALQRLVIMGYLTRQWDTKDTNMPRRRLYTLIEKPLPPTSVSDTVSKTSCEGDSTAQEDK